MSSNKYFLEKQNLEECLNREPTESILSSDSEPKEYVPVWGKVKTMTVTIGSGEDFQIEVEETDMPSEDNSVIENENETTESSAVQLLEQAKNVEEIIVSGSQEIEMDDYIAAGHGIENLLKPEVQNYLKRTKRLINLKYGIKSKADSNVTNKEVDDKECV